MSQYGYVLDKDQSNKKIYDIFSEYFDDPILTKVKENDNESIYMVKVKLLIQEKRYIIAIVSKDRHSFGTQFKLSKIKWNILQMRELDNDYNTAEFTYMPKNSHPYNMEITRLEKNNKMSIYSNTKLNLKIALLHKNENIYEFSDKGKINTAIETYRTVFKIV